MKLRFLLKNAAAVLVGLLLLDGFCAWYYNPAPYEYAEHRATDVIREPGALYAQAKEGLCVARVDENGYNNPAGIAEECISVLFMGSSHAEGFNVLADDNAARLLDGMLRADGREGHVYNIAISNHDLPRNAANLGRALEAFAPSDYVVIETSEVYFSPGSVYGSMNDAIARMSATEVPLEAISHRPLSKRLYKQWMDLFGKGEADIARVLAQLPLAQAAEGDPPAQIASDANIALANYGAAIAEWMTQLRGTAEEAGVRLIICYHPRLTPQLDGSVTVASSPEYLRAFSEACEAAGVLFVDMSERFLQTYEAEHILPHGFANTAMGQGHLNADGQRLVAEALYDAILEAEGGRA